MAVSTRTENVFIAAMGSTPAAQEITAILNTVDVLSGTEAAFIDGVTAGTAAASKAVVLGTSRECATIGALTVDGDLTITDADVVLSATTGTKIGTATSQKLGFYNATPVDQPATIADPSGGATQDAEARTAINAIIDALQELGLLA